MDDQKLNLDNSFKFEDIENKFNFNNNENLNSNENSNIELTYLATMKPIIISSRCLLLTFFCL